MKTPTIKPIRWLVACRIGGENTVYQFSRKSDAVAFQRDCKARGVETALAKWTH